ncbi:carbohydrate binding domain-containing protein [Flavobacterium sp. FlaQc-48]|uniref:carbohydrate binding domain-containing protein n=1 Tax=Flavobacterium sp. FlaQc-48 TaxID=3374181 RepID=UPI0037575462
MKKSITLTTLLFAGGQLFAQENLLKVNEGFETGKLGWYIPSDQANKLLITEEAQHDGKYGLKILAGNGSTKFYTQSSTNQTFAIQSNKKYKLEFWIKTLQKGHDITLEVYSENQPRSAQDVKAYLNMKPVKEGEWQLSEIEFNGFDSPKAKFALSINKGQYLLDSFKLIEKKD